MPVEPQFMLDELEAGSGDPLDQAKLEVGERHSPLVNLFEQALEIDAILIQDVRQVQLSVALHPCHCRAHDPELTRVTARVGRAFAGEIGSTFVVYSLRCSARSLGAPRRPARVRLQRRRLVEGKLPLSCDRVAAMLEDDSVGLAPPCYSSKEVGQP
jgi:hypothetical protein